MDDTQELTARYILQWFSPRWFISVMGTGAIANVYQLLSGKTVGALHILAEVFLTLALIVFVLSAVFMVVRLLVGWDCVLKEWRHASLIQFYSAISIAAAVCATGLINIPLSFLSPATAIHLATVFWWIAVLVGIVFIFFGPFKVTVGPHAHPGRALAYWFLPPVGFFVLVFAGNFLATRMTTPSAVQAMLFFNAMILGVAIGLTVILYTIILFRYLFYNFPRRDVAPSFMIGLAPVGVSIIALHTLLPVVVKSGTSVIDVALLGSIVKILSIPLWSFGLWFLIYASLVIGYYFIKQGVPVTLGYWAFVFPPAAYTLATLLLAKSLGLPQLKTVAIVLAVLVTTAWLIDVVLTVRGMLDRTIFDVAPTFKGDIPYL